jgi:putative membrane protein
MEIAMYDYNAGYYGMHFGWWIFWVVLWVSMFSFWTPVSRRQWQTIKESPLDILKRRLAKGEIDETQYQSLREHLMRDKGPETTPNLKRAY